ncbi:MAG: hypothetical protein RLZZ140_372 [Pseudomonadota bacterium]
MAITLSLLLIVLLLLVGVPFWVSLGLGTTVMLATTSALPLTLIGEALFEGVDSFALIAIPLFILTGDIMVRSKLAHDLLGFAEATFGSLKSGFGTSTVMGCGLFACISGSDAADAAAIGRISPWHDCKNVATPRPMPARLLPQALAQESSFRHQLPTSLLAWCSAYRLRRYFRQPLFPEC